MRLFLKEIDSCIGGLKKSGFEKYDLSGYAADDLPVDLLI